MTIRRWIKASKKLPTQNQEIIIAIPGYDFTVRSVFDLQTYQDGIKEHSMFSHWMPDLPLPKEHRRG